MNYGVIVHPSKPDTLVVYESFNEGWRAVELGNGIPIGIDAVLREAIEADVLHKRVRQPATATGRSGEDSTP